MKKLSALVIVFALTFAVGSSYSQPQLTFHIKGAYNLPLPDLKGDVLDSADQVNTFGMSHGYGFGADAKYYLGKKRNVGITLDLMYDIFSSGTEDSTALGKNFESKLNAFAVGLGVEYAFMPKGKVNPFIGLEFTGHFFSGKTEFETTDTAGNPISYSADLKSASRFGAAVGFGLDFMLSKSIGVVVGAKYHLANLIGKEDSVSVGANEYALLDKEHTVTSPAGTVTIDSKNISYLQPYLGLSIYLNQPKKKVKK